MYIGVSAHAVARHLERFPGPTDRVERRDGIAQAVMDSFQQHRYSSREPRFLGNGGRKRGRRNGKELDRSIRWCWTADEECVFLVDRRPNLAIVITVIRAGEPSSLSDTLPPDGR